MCRSDGSSLLHLSCADGNVPFTKRMLLDGCIHLNSRRKDGSTPLLLAAQFGQLDVVYLLTTQGADVNMARNDGSTPIHIAASQGNCALARALLEGANRFAL